MNQKTNKKPYRIVQIMGPPADAWDTHPNLILDGWPIHCGETLTVLFPGGWQCVSIELDCSKDGIEGWYFPERRNVSPVGLFCRVPA